MQSPKNAIFRLDLSPRDLSFKFLGDIDTIIDTFAVFDLKDGTRALFEDR